jgi:hypothetical protein
MQWKILLIWAWFAASELGETLIDYTIYSPLVSLFSVVFGSLKMLDLDMFGIL